MVYEGGGGLKKSKKLSTWFMNDPYGRCLNGTFPCLYLDGDFPAIKEVND